MSIYQIPSRDIHCVTPEAQFGARWSVRIPVPLSAIDEDVSIALRQVFTLMRLGDEFVIMAFDSDEGAWRENANIRQIGTYRVVEKSRDTAKLVRVGFYEIDKPKPGSKPGDIVALDIVPHQGAFEVRDRIGNVLEVFRTEEAAIEFRDAYQGATGVVGFKVRKGFGRWDVLDESGAVRETFTSLKDAEAWMQSGGQKAP